MKPFISKYALIFMLLGVAVSRGYFDVVWKVFSSQVGVTYLFIIIITIILSHSQVLIYQQLITFSSLNVSILSQFQVLMSASCHILQCWCQHLVRFSSLDVNIFSHSQVLMSTSSRSLSLSSMQTSQSSHTCWALKSPLMPEEEKWCAVMNRKYLVHNFTTQRDQESLKFWIGNSLCTSGPL